MVKRGVVVPEYEEAMNEQANSAVEWRERGGEGTPVSGTPGAAERIEDEGASSAAAPPAGGVGGKGDVR